ncbi:MAG: phosphoglycerate dehydrogenase, partial [Verrucomicrobia bacterium GWC2_42_7]
MKVVIADPIVESALLFLKQQPNMEVIDSHKNKENLPGLLMEADALLVRSETKVTRELLAGAPKLKVVGRAGIGVDNIDVEAATERGIAVLNAPCGNTIATAELTCAHLLSSARPLPQASASMKEGKWDRKAFIGIELFKKTLGIIGLGRIGTEVASRAHAFGMTVIAYDPYLSDTRAKNLNIKKVTLGELFAESDFITVHVPLVDSTRNLLDEKAFAQMKKGVHILNCARGGIVHEEALINAIKNGIVASAGLDVYQEEPLPVTSELRKLPNVTLTPHLGASTKEAQESVGMEIVHELCNFLNGQEVKNAVNMPCVDMKTLQAIGPFIDLGQKMGSLLQQMSPSFSKKIRISYWGKLTQLDASPITRAIQRGYVMNIGGPQVNDINAPLKLKQLGIEVEVVNSNSDSEYTELVGVETVETNAASLQGTIIGKNPRIVSVHGYQIEIAPVGILLSIENKDCPGTIGKI